MMRPHFPPLGVVVSLLLLGSVTITSAQLRPPFDSIDTVIFYPAYGVQHPTTRVWTVRLRAKVQEKRSIERFAALFLKLPKQSSPEENNFRDRMEDLVADDKSDEKVVFQFDADASQKEYRIEKGDGRFPETNGDGIVTGIIRLTDSDAQRLLTAQGSRDRGLTYRATSPGHEGSGKLRLIGPSGVSVISDIDDTIKITEVPASKTTVVINTFYRDFAAAPELMSRFRGLGDDAAFHYVSGGPWQLYRPVSAFLITGGRVPEGSFHMKDVSGNITRPITSLEKLYQFLRKGSTVDHKVEQITTIMNDFPDRTFILIGDSGECDPEVYRQVKNNPKLTRRVQEIVIRDVVNARERAASRLTGMTIVNAPTVVDGDPAPKCGSGSR